MRINRRNQVVRQDGAVAIIRMKSDPDTRRPPPSTHWYTSRLIYRDQDCPNTAYKEKDVFANMAVLDKPDEIDYTSVFINAHLETDPHYFDYIRTLFKENEDINPATCSELVLAILEKRGLNECDISKIAGRLNVPVSDFYQDIEYLTSRLDAEFAQLDEQYNEDIQFIAEEDRETYATKFGQLYQDVRDKYEILRPFYYKNRVHIFLNMYRNIVYNRLIQKDLFQIVWVRQDANIDVRPRCPAQDKHWIYIGYKKIRLDDEHILYYEYVEYQYNKTENSMFQIDFDDTTKIDSSQSDNQFHQDIEPL